MYADQVAGLLVVASKRISYCETIIKFPAKSGKKNFDNTDPASQFYKNVCNTSFYDAVLIVGSLLDSDTRVVSLLNWAEFMSEKDKEIRAVIQKFKSEGFKEIRDQLIAHVDIDNSNNMFPHLRTQGVVDSNLILKLRLILDSLIVEFLDYTKKNNKPYSPNYFDVDGSVKEVEFVLDGQRPVLTDNYMI